MAIGKKLYEEVTQKMVAALENGVVPWIKPWDATSSLPTNIKTKRPYRGVNIALLWLSAMDRGFSTDRWLTFKQAKEVGGIVKGGEKGTRVVLWKPPTQSRNENDVDVPEKRVFPLVRSFTVFNEAQIDGLPKAKVKPVIWEPEELAEQFLSLADVQYGGDRAFFSPDKDIIQLPAKNSFSDTAGFYSTSLHEITHWTGHSDRLDRLEKTPYGSPEYAREELVAEMGAAFLCAETKIPGNLQHPEYLSHWLKILKKDSRAIFQAASKAQQAVDLLKDAREKQTVKTALERAQRVRAFRPDTCPAQESVAA